MNIKSSFKAGVVARQLKATWLNSVAWFLNKLHGGTHIEISVPTTPGDGDGPSVGIDMEGLCADLKNRGFYVKTSKDDASSEDDDTKPTENDLAMFDEDGNLVDSGQPKPDEGNVFVQGEMDSITPGNLVKAGPANSSCIEDTGVAAPGENETFPVIPSSGLASGEVLVGSGTRISSSGTKLSDLVTSKQADTKISEAFADYKPPVPDLSGYVKEEDLGEAATMDVGTEEGTVAAGDHTHSLDDIQDTDCTAKCLAIVDGTNGGTFGHSASQLTGADALGGDWMALYTFFSLLSYADDGGYKLPVANVDGSRLTASSFVATDATGNLVTPGNQPATVSADAAANAFAAVDSTGNLYTPDDQPPVYGDTPTDGAFVAVDSDGNLVTPDDQPVMADPGTPSSTSNMTSGAVTSASRTANSEKKTFSGPTGSGSAKTTPGIVIYVACRAVNDGMNGSVFFRPFTITCDGRIRSIGAESANAFTMITS